MRVHLLFFSILIAIGSTPVFSNNIVLKNVSNEWSFRGSIVSAFPGAIKNMNLRENFEVKEVFQFNDPKDNQLVRVELFFTGGDAETYPQFYIFTNARNGKSIIESSSSTRFEVYYISDFSSPDLELGEIAPKIDPFESSIHVLRNYILRNFFKKDGVVSRDFIYNCPFYMRNISDATSMGCRDY